MRALFNSIPGDMNTRTFSVAMRTRAKTLEKLQADCHKRKEKEKEKSNAKNAVKRKKGDWKKEECDPKELKIRKENEKEKSNATNAVKRKKGDERKEKKCDPKELKKRKEKEKSKATNAKKRKLGDEKKEKECNPKEFNKRKGRRKGIRVPSDPDDDEESDSDVQIVREECARAGDSLVHVNVDNDDDASDCDVRIVSEECIGPSDRSDYLKGSKFFPRRSKRGRRDENWTIERINNGESSRGKSKLEATKAKDMSVDHSGSSNPESSSSEEEADDSDDNDYTEEESVSSDTESDSLSYCSDDDIGEGDDKDDSKISPVERSDKEIEDCDDDEPKANANENENLVQGNCSEEQWSSNGDGFKEKRADGLDIWVDINKRDGEKQLRRSIRLQPRSVPESKKKELSLGTYSQPVPVHENDDDSDSSDDDNAYSDHVAKKTKKSCEKVEKLPKKRGRPPKVVNVKNAINLLVDSIFDEGEALNKLLSPNDKKAPPQKVLPLKFGFEDEDPAPPEKEEWQKEIDSLFAELEMGLAEFDSDVNTSSMVGYCCFVKFFEILSFAGYFSLLIHHLFLSFLL